MAAELVGVYRGIVRAGADPSGAGRLLVLVPDVLGLDAVWAQTSHPVPGLTAGAVAVPPEGTRCWVQFEAGDPARPVVTGWSWAG
ncbi:phage baseplate assembly protein V [Aquipuribacter sp. MA13-6]|uniref:phage baseplate assembly protein V n=1 Tax=unclassified Aquipuribacter TaxID=2635084 RepID=UPI003EEFC4FB